MGKVWDIYREGEGGCGLLALWLRVGVSKVKIIKFVLA